jgi:diacylglycerol kinase (ATP)
MHEPDVPPSRVLLVVNPRTCAGPRARVAAAAIARLRQACPLVAELATHGDGDDPQRIFEAIEKEQPDVVAAAGGDGTVGLALGALLRATNGAAGAALAILPLGTGNNAARSFGLRSLRSEGARALVRCIDAIAKGARTSVDVGSLNGRPFLGSFAIGLDGEILARRNRIHDKLGGIGTRTGYGLYLASFVASIGSSLRPWRARLVLDGVAETELFYNLVVSNTPVYAGPLRFDGASHCADGKLDLHAVASPRGYVAEYPLAWIRYLRALSGREVAPSALLRRAREIVLTPERAVPAHVDGEELAPAASYRLAVLPRALRVCTPPSSP